MTNARIYKIGIYFVDMVGGEAVFFVYVEVSEVMEMSGASDNFHHGHRRRYLLLASLLALEAVAAYLWINTLLPERSDCDEHYYSSNNSWPNFLYEQHLACPLQRLHQIKFMQQRNHQQEHQQIRRRLQEAQGPPRRWRQRQQRLY